MALAGTRQMDGSPTESIQEDDLRAALRDKARQMRVRILGISALLTLTAFVWP